MAASLDPNLPAAPPPPGIESNFVDPPSQKMAIIILEATFLPLMGLAVAIRVWVRLRAGAFKTWGIDDSMC
jgi:hypothetical protein